MNTLFTIGHSDHTLERFLSLLQQHGVDWVADVRSSPYSRIHDQFNREGLSAYLKRNGIGYAFFGRELGARRDERESYRGRQARYDLICKLPAFREGLERIQRGVATHRIALMCAEKDPITCHRMVLVCRHVRSIPIDVRHVLPDGTFETTQQAEVRLLDAVGLPQVDLFSSTVELVERAYDMQAEQIAYTESEPSPAAAG